MGRDHTEIIFSLDIQEALSDLRARWCGPQNPDPAHAPTLVALMWVIRAEMLDEVARWVEEHEATVKKESLEYGEKGSY